MLLLSLKMRSGNIFIFPDLTIAQEKVALRLKESVTMEIMFTLHKKFIPHVYLTINIQVILVIKHCIIARAQCG